MHRAQAGAGVRRRGSSMHTCLHTFPATRAHDLCYRVYFLTPSAYVPIIEKKAIPIAPTIPISKNNSNIISIDYIGNYDNNVKY